LVNKYFIIKSKTLLDKFNVGVKKLESDSLIYVGWGVANKSSNMMGER
jgi:hypothetical protein